MFPLRGPCFSMALRIATCACRRSGPLQSLDEGFEETLTLYRLGLFGALGISLKTTNCIESLLSQVGAYTDKVDRWRTSEQKHRWVASALLSIEPRLHRIKGYRHLPLLREALQREIASNAQRCENVA